MEHYEMRLLADYTQPAPPAVQAANTWNRPTPAAVGGELEADERGEVVFAEIQPPVDGIGINDEDLRKVVIVLDGHEIGEYVSLSGIRTTLMAPVKERIWGAKLYSFGTPRSTNPLLNTTLKYKSNVTVACLAGPAAAGITGASQQYRVRLWGYVYKTGELPTAFNGGVMQFPAYLSDTARRRTVNISKAPIPINGETWQTLPGGVNQGIPKINPFARYAYNALATDGLQGDYQFRFTQAGVIDENENLYFEFDDKDALLVLGLGVSPSFDTLMPPAGVFPNLARTGLRIAGDYHPKGPTTRLSMFPTDALMNQLNYGWFPVVLNVAAPIAPLDIYVAIPKLDRPYLIWNEIGYVTIRDNGVAAVPADPLGVTVAVTGIRVEMRS
ncbi:hypothetical protein ES707_03667 [subsurface metagenome]